MIFSETNQDIAPALAKAWAAVNNPKHNAKVTVYSKKNNSSYTFEYTDLQGIFDEIKPVLAENGLMVMQDAHTETIDGVKMISVETMLLHKSGEWVKNQPLQMPAAPNVQDVGGLITYMKRYSLSSLMGIATEKDDDANGSVGNEYYDTTNQGPRAVPSLINSKQMYRIRKLLEEVGRAYNKDKSDLFDVVRERIGRHQPRDGKSMEEDMRGWSRDEASQSITYLENLKQSKQA